MKAEDAHTSDSSDESMPDQDAQDGESDSHEVAPLLLLHLCMHARTSQLTSIKRPGRFSGEHILLACTDILLLMLAFVL